MLGGPYGHGCSMTDAVWFFDSLQDDIQMWKGERLWVVEVELPLSAIVAWEEDGVKAKYGWWWWCETDVPVSAIKRTFALDSMK